MSGRPLITEYIAQTYSTKYFQDQVEPGIQILRVDVDKEVRKAATKKEASKCAEKQHLVMHILPKNAIGSRY